MNNIKTNDKPAIPDLTINLINKAAKETGWNKADFATKAEKAREQAFQDWAEELDNLNLAVAFTEILIDAGHPDPAAWLVEVIGEEITNAPKSWPRQIHKFASRWIVYLAGVHGGDIDTIKLRAALADEGRPIEWLGHLEHSLAPFIMQHRLFMTLEQATAYGENEIKVFSVKPEGVEELVNDPAAQILAGRIDQV